MLVDLLVALVGLALVCTVLADFVSTTLSLHGSGWLSRWVMFAAWRSSRFLSRSVPLGGAAFGTTVLLAPVVTWAVLLWLGWLLFFLPFSGAVLASSPTVPADFWSRAYFVGYSVITLGVGDFVPSGPVFQIATVLAAMSGFFLMTLGVTYLVPVVSAVVQERQLAAQIMLLGRTPGELARYLVDEEAGESTISQLQALTGPLLLQAERLYAYPVLSYYTSSDRSTSIGVGVAVLDEALSILQFALPAQAPAPARLLSLRRAVDLYLRHRVTPQRSAPITAPPAPSLAPLKRAGLDTVSQDEFEGALTGIDERRQRLAALLSLEERQWHDVSDEGEPKGEVM